MRLARSVASLLVLTACAHDPVAVGVSPVHAPAAPKPKIERLTPRPDARLDDSPPSTVIEPVAVPDVHVTVLPNGLRIVTLRKSDLPMVIETAIFDVGYDDAPIAMVLMAHVSLEIGDPSLRPPRLAVINQYFGIRFRESVLDRSQFFQVTSMRGNLDVGTKILARILRAPAPPVTDFQSIRERASRQLDDSARSSEPRAGYELASMIDSDHFVTLRKLQSSLQTVSPESAEAFKSRMACPEHATIVIVGDFEESSAVRRIENRFASWTCDRAPEASPRIIAMHDRRVRLVDHPGQTTANVIVGALAPSDATERNVLDLRAIKDVLAGVGGRLFHSVRDQDELSYAVSADLDYHRAYHVLRVHGVFPTSQTSSGILDILTELGRLRTDLVPPDELASATRKVAVSHFVSVGALASWLSAWPRDGNTMDAYLKTSLSPLDVSPEELREAAVHFLAPEHLQIVVVGDAKMLLPELQKLDLGPIEVVH